MSSSAARHTARHATTRSGWSTVRGPRRFGRTALLVVASLLSVGCSVLPLPPTGPTGPPAPAAVLDLTNWKLTLPVSAVPGADATEVLQPQLRTFVLAPWFVTDSAHDGVVFRADAGGATSSGSSYPRSELREMAASGTREASWSTTSGTSTLSLTQAVTRVPVVKPQVVVAQVHGASSDVVEVLADGSRSTSAGTIGLCVRYNGKEQATCLDPRYRLGTRYALVISASQGAIRVTYQGTTTLTFTSRTSGNYFKAGAYTQSNPSKGDAASAQGQVVIYRLLVTHT